MPFFVQNSANGFAYPSVFLIAIILSYLTFKSIKNSKEAGEGGFKIYESEDSKSSDSQIKFYWRWIVMSVVAFPLLSFIVYMDLNDLESGTVEGVRLWFPIAFLYKQFGYWTAILSVIAIGLICISVFGRKIYLSRMQNKN